MATVTLIKQGTNMAMPVQFSGLSLDDVSSIDFYFKQGSTTWEISYPSDYASRRDGEDDIVDIIWKESDTWRFEKQHDILMDTRVTLMDSWQNPYTPIVTFRIGRTLFPQTEETDGDDSDSTESDTTDDTTTTTDDTTTTVDDDTTQGDDGDDQG